ncbi:leukemia inhibitory factor receptor-like [Pristis pectinata]|uniref:leukemia inhibitory factor receptor-like n=1 Tax=Pristis pectinata TaxID=685728 RepID=UPI00223E81ED|nr:leukemia inhibitory factor receptor-like [Pristis pectinata]XP_051876080.1 leukemia inhibitory factor receptor-like [Pristis pectinata]XP_051876081.1 leukemia inhibitory factor receptor-like [Pristis pectinata]XP_051876082.1 leukemia inhibitory factor receptor-like [Pristis pectinata]
MDLFKAGRMKQCVFLKFMFLVLSLSGCDLVSAWDNDSCGSIFPNRLVASVSSSHNITCSFCKDGAADKVQWIYGGSALPSSQFIKINSSASMAMLTNLSLTNREGENLTCISDEESKTMLIQTGYPPDAPRDLKCITQNFDKINCSWDQGRDTNIETNYTSCSWSPTDCTNVGKANFVEHDFLVFSMVILQITAVNELGTQMSEKFSVKESDIVFIPYTPKLNRVFQDPSNDQVMVVEWFEGGEAYELDLKMIFQTQVLQAYKMQEVWVGNYSSTLDFTRNRVLQLTWTSDMPLQCTSYLVKIRSIGNDDDFLFTGKRAWSEWSPPLKLDGRDVTDQTEFEFYPPDSTVLEAGSSPVFCCVAGKGKRVKELNFDGLNFSSTVLSNRSMVVRVPNVPPSRESGANVICISSLNKLEGATVFIGYPPDTPKNISCETRDLQTLNCTWEPGRSTQLVSKHKTIYSLNIGSSQNPLPCEHALNTEYWCSFRISNRSGVTNISIHAKNSLGKVQSSITVDAAHVFRPFAPHQLREEKTTPYNTTLSWSDQVNYTDINLHCEVVIRDESGQIMSLNYSLLGNPTNTQHTITLINLQPNAEYSIRARYSSVHFWKWSEWSNVVEVKTKITAPSVSLDVWRTVMPNQTVTIYWKPLLATEANGPILFYNVTWSKMGSDSINSTRIRGTSVQIHLDQAGYVITTMAQNGAGTSPPSVIKIPPQQDDENLTFEKITGIGDGFIVTWPTQQAENCGYTVQWCESLSLPVCRVDWRKFPSNTTGVTIKSDTFQAGVQYSLEVYECGSNGDHLLKKLLGYTRELAPTEGPKVEISKTTGDSVQIEWKDVPLEKQRGFIEGFKIYYSKFYNDSAANKPVNSGNQSANIILDPDKRAFKILGLEPGTTYNVGVRAFTSGGDSPSNSVTVTTPNSPIALILGITLPLIGFIGLGVVLSIFCYQKQEWIKDTFYPDIPDPTNSKVLDPGSFPQGVNLCKTLEPKDCTPNEVHVVEDKPIVGEANKSIKAEEQGEVVPEDDSENEIQHQGVISYRPSSTSLKMSGEPNPAFEAAAPLVTCVYPSEVTYTSIRGPAPPQQEAAGPDQMEDDTEVIVKSGYQPQIHMATNPALDREQPDLTLHVNGYQPQMHNKSWSLDSGDLLPLEPDSIGSPTSINSQAFLIPEKMMGDELKPSGIMWSLPFFNSRMSSNSYGNSNHS